MSYRFTFDTIDRLVSRVVAGETVFLTGAGFSLDSEPNTSGRLIRRLVMRFAAITEHLVQAAQPGIVDSAANSAAGTAAQLREGLRITFDLEPKKMKSEAMVTGETIDKLKAVYYNINDWMCSSYAILLRALRGVDAAAMADIRERERRLNNKPGGGFYDEVALGDFDVAKLLALGNDAGKGLFLETMGFASSEVWGGDPRADDRQTALDSYAGRIRDRHHTLARLAREGLTPLILTTNFDLLVEGACRVAGFELEDMLGAPKEIPADSAKPSATYDRLSVVAGPTEFFERGGAFRAALLLKIHGCVHRYREEQKKGSPVLARYLPSMVFTYREIQNWRKDSWSRDLVSTLLRTRSIVLCGYSGADPVVHDTFRTVYEEILAHQPEKQQQAGSVVKDAAAGKDGAGGLPGTPVKSCENTRAFFTGAAGKSEFAGLEILRAGSRAAGLDEPPLVGHPNYVPFHFQARPGKPQAFPTMDEVFLWIYHLTLRRLQLEAIRSDLGRTAVMLLRRNVAPADIEQIGAALQQQCQLENELARRWEDKENSRREFRKITAWTNRFHVALLREFALMETVARNQRSSLRIQEFREGGYYFPLLDRPGWGAWGAMVEIALRRMSGLGRVRTAAAVDSDYPVALVTSGAAEFTRTAVVLHGPGRYSVPQSAVPGHYRRIHEWQLMDWLSGENGTAGTPPPKEVWRWALLRPDELKREPPCEWFGGLDDPKRKRESQRAGGAQGRSFSIGGTGG